MNTYHKSLIKRIIILFVTIWLISIPLHTHAASDQTVIRKQVNTLLKACKKYDLAKIRSCTGGAKILYTSDKTFIRLIKKGNNKYFSADIQKIKVSKDKATVYLNVTELSGWNVSISAISEYSDYLDRSPKALKNAIKKYYYYAITDPQEGDIVTYKCKLTYVKNNGKWVVKPDKKLYELMDGGLCTLLLDFAKNPKKYL